MTRKLETKLAGPAPTRRVLALDGGGVRGLLTLGILEELEMELRQRAGRSDYRLCEYFDLIGGTSTGSIIATGLALGMSVAEISALYKLLVPVIFKDPAMIGGVWTPRFKSGPLTKALGGAFGFNSLASPNLRTGLALFCKRMDSGAAWALTNNPRWKYYDSNKVFMLRDLVQASAAAPHFFEGVMLSLQEHDEDNPGATQASRPPKQDFFFVDGGVSGNNNPTLEMLMLVRDPAYGFGWSLGASQLYVLSLGTGYLRERHKAKEYRQKPFFEQTVNALRGMINDVGLQQIATVQALSDSQVRWMINSEKLDQAAAPYLTSSAICQYQRMDARIEAPPPGGARPEHAASLMGRALSETEYYRLADITCGLDANAALLNEIGRQAGQHYLRVAPPLAVFDPPAV
jgi:uncharacterized protein